MRYQIQRFKLDKDHPQWPNEQVYRIADNFTGYVSLSCYTTLESAEKMLDLKLTRLKNGV